ncbi:DUF5988 family protein [Kitasatospora sp. NPDC097605]|uniref:DUF5988 family protein n=1 Tax=Kitasatospora sp. NPDC097605 TaxID=3157226 RepID=UPI003329DA5D
MRRLSEAAAGGGIGRACHVGVRPVEGGEECRDGFVGGVLEGAAVEVDCDRQGGSASSSSLPPQGAFDLYGTSSPRKTANTDFSLRITLFRGRIRMTSTGAGAGSTRVDSRLRGLTMHRFTEPQLIGVPEELLRESPSPVREDDDRLTYRWRNGYERYEFEEAASSAHHQPTYQWAYHTTIAE